MLALRRDASIRGFLPTLTTNAQAGMQWFKVIDDTVTWTWQIGAQLNWPLFDGLATVGTLRANRAAALEAQQSFESTARLAREEVENALLAEQELGRRLAIVQRQEDLARQAYEQASSRWADGLEDFLTVLSAQNTLQNTQLTLLQARRDLLGARTSLHTALGGAWTRRSAGASR